MIKKEKCEKLGRVPTEMELILEYTQQGISHEVSVFTMKMEIMLESTSNKLMVGNIKGEWRYLFPVEPQFITTCSYPTNQDFRYSDVFQIGRQGGRVLEGFMKVRPERGDKEVMVQDLVDKVVMEVVSRMLGDIVVRSWRCLRC
nr:hypothetical protein [Tanacetum cinerariifolium]